MAAKTSAFMRALLAVVTTVSLTSACASSADSEELERRSRLFAMETDNLRHERDLLQSDMAKAKADASVVEQRCAEAQAQGDERLQVADAARRRAAQAEARVAALEAELANVRDLILSGRIDNKEDRKSLLSALPAPALAPANPPGATSH